MAVLFMTRDRLVQEAGGFLENLEEGHYDTPKGSQERTEGMALAPVWAREA